MSEKNGEDFLDEPVQVMDVSNGVAQTEFKMEDVHDASMVLLELLEETEIDVQLGTVALALTLGRVVSPKVLEPEEEVKFIQSIMEYVQLYFVEGVKN